jgi:RimJ/RimL family protein N-acetyltransferase
MTRPDELETFRLRLRRWRDGDLDALARWQADPRVMEHMGRGPMSRAEAARSLARMTAHWEAHGFGVWAAEEKETEELVGRIGLAYHSEWPDDPEVGWMLDPTCWGRGLATEGGRAAMAYGFEHLRAPRIVSICTPENTASRRVMARLGLRYLTEKRHAALGVRLWIHARDADASGGNP